MTKSCENYGKVAKKVGPWFKFPSFSTLQQLQNCIMVCEKVFQNKIRTKILAATIGIEHI
jgi:hypothetical protein